MSETTYFVNSCLLNLKFDIEIIVQQMCITRNVTVTISIHVKLYFREFEFNLVSVKLYMMKNCSDRVM